jgi:hypothetical protein
MYYTSGNRAVGDAENVARADAGQKKAFNGRPNL